MKKAWWMLVMMAVAPAAERPVKMADSARLHLTVPEEGSPLRDVRVEVGSVAEGSWLEDAAARERLSDVSIPVSWWRWREAVVHFNPQADGEVELSLNGPWEAAEDGEPWRQEVLWDDFRASGASIYNGDFSAGRQGWESPWAEYPDAAEWPLEGAEVGASWHGRPLVRRLVVEKGRPVELRFRTKAAVPEGFVEPRRLGRDTPAHRAAAKLKRGVNLGNGWEAEPGTWGLSYTVEDVERIAEAGFDHIRVPVAWHFHLEDREISHELLGKLEPVLRRALDRGLRVLLDWHHFEALCKAPGAHRGEFVDGWRVIARHFAEWPEALHFELLNEPCLELGGELLNEVHAEALEAIRRSNPERIVVVNPGGWSVVGSLGALRLPDGEERVIVSVHCYEPFEFTHQGAGWVGLEPLTGVVFPGPPEKPLAMPDALEDRFGLQSWLEVYNTRSGAENPSSIREVERLLSEAAEWSKVFGRPVHLGEFGAYEAADLASRKRYAEAVRRAAENQGIPWCWWEWKAGFGCWDAERDEPVLVEELMR